MHYYHEWKQSESQRQEEKQIRINGYMVKQGKQNTMIPFDEILSFYTMEGYTALLTLQGKKYILDKSLDKIGVSICRESISFG
ncbi:MAG: hypothetical protein QM764_09170 [Chitinophagaceae bacterium]